jgi:hypothetical protein
MPKNENTQITCQSASKATNPPCRLEYFDPTDDALTLALKDAVLSSMELLPHLWAQPGKKTPARFDNGEEPFADSMRR